MHRRRRGKLRKRYGHEHVGSLHALRNMETARHAYRAARSRGARAAFNSAMNSVRHVVGTGAWDIANTVKRESGD